MAEDHEIQGKVFILSGQKMITIQLMSRYEMLIKLLAMGKDMKGLWYGMVLLFVKSSAVGCFKEEEIVAGIVYFNQNEAAKNTFCQFKFDSYGIQNNSGCF